MIKQKAPQKSDIPIQVINADIFADYLGETLNSAMKTSNFPNCFKIGQYYTLTLKRLQIQLGNL